MSNNNKRKRDQSLADTNGAKRQRLEGPSDRLLLGRVPGATELNNINFTLLGGGLGATTEAARIFVPTAGILSSLIQGICAAHLPGKAGITGLDLYRGASFMSLRAFNIVTRRMKLCPDRPRTWRESSHASHDAGTRAAIVMAMGLLCTRPSGLCLDLCREVVQCICA